MSDNFLCHFHWRCDGCRRGCNRLPKCSACILELLGAAIWKSSRAPTEQEMRVTPTASPTAGLHVARCYIKGNRTPCIAAPSTLTPQTTPPQTPPPAARRPPRAGRVRCKTVPRTDTPPETPGQCGGAPPARRRRLCQRSRRAAVEATGAAWRWDV